MDQSIDVCPSRLMHDDICACVCIDQWTHLSVVHFHASSMPFNCMIEVLHKCEKQSPAKGFGTRVNLCDSLHRHKQLLCNTKGCTNMIVWVGSCMPLTCLETAPFFRYVRQCLLYSNTSIKRVLVGMDEISYRQEVFKCKSYRSWKVSFCSICLG